MPNVRNRELNLITRESLYNAVIYHLQEKEYGKLTISAICDRAGVSRNAYYRNFDSIDDVMILHLTERLTGKYREYTNQVSSASKITYFRERMVYRILKEEQDLLRLLYERDILYILQKSLYKAFSVPDSAVIDKKSRFCAFIRTHAVFGLVIAMIEDGFTMDEEEFAVYLEEMSIF